METPRSFMRPYNKGLIPLLQFGVGGGATRHLTGFTRIKNSKTIMKLLEHNDAWKNTIDVPRKWYWLPEYPWIKITTEHLGGINTVKTVTLPGAYIIIADYIEAEKDNLKDLLINHFDVANKGFPEFIPEGLKPYFMKVINND